MNTKDITQLHGFELIELLAPQYDFSTKYHDREEIITVLQSFASHFSFWRVISQIYCKEFVRRRGEKVYDDRSPEEIITNNEINFLCELWVNNVNFSYPNWEVDCDGEITVKTSILLQHLHLTYIQPVPEEYFKHLFFYAGDEAYWPQLIDFTPQKYQFDKQWLSTHKGIYIDIVPFFFQKIISLLKYHCSQCKQNNTDMINAFVFKEEEINAMFCDDEERNLINLFTTTIPRETKVLYHDIGDRNLFSFSPMIKFPNNSFYLPNPHSFAKALYESPFYWIMDDKSYQIKKGESTEEIVLQLLTKYINNYSLCEKDIKIKNSSGSEKTDIDVLLVQNDTAICFQIKAKQLTELSKQGDINHIEDDFDKAVKKAYHQGIESINALKEREKYKFSKTIDGIENDTKFYNICILSDMFPAITTLVSTKSKDITENGIPVIAFSIFDLDMILQAVGNSFCNYVAFRTQLEVTESVTNEMACLSAYLRQNKGETVDTITMLLARDIDERYLSLQ